MFEKITNRRFLNGIVLGLLVWNELYKWHLFELNLSTDIKILKYRLDIFAILLYVIIECIINAWIRATTSTKM